MYFYVCASMRRYLGQSARGGIVTWGCQDHLQSAPKCGSPGNPVLSSSPKHQTPSSMDHNNKLMDGDHGISRELSFSRRLPAPSASPSPDTILSGTSPDLSGGRRYLSSRRFLLPGTAASFSFFFSSRENRAPKYGNTYLVNNGVSQRDCLPSRHCRGRRTYRLAQISQWDR
ncbi:hypothetical protein CPAR01_15654 [Colletotrichum paranaense]|uniref:Uncharacterized protein n=1 Tax=Colletotrichum paranaense TaxID=1914294 RepID=A0ABQ9RYI9_9PEZI|nr:uncharacterized protein CPAR01_15654 [Colletotrichum paranaense]KAK1519216.1 hypothetical protein CPAR01_15654 [Colletotrichum paranaense]